MSEVSRGQYKRINLPWGAMRDDTRVRRVKELLREGDLEPLWSLVEHYVTLRGKAGAKTSAHTMRSYRTGMKQYLGYLMKLGFAGDELVEIVLEPGRDLGAEYIRQLERSGRSPGTVNSRRASASAFYRALRWAGATTHDPFDDVPAVRDPTARDEKRQPYEPDALSAMLTACENPIETALIQLGARGGLRVSEVASLKWEAVDLNSKRLKVEHGKGGKRRTVSILPKLLEALTAIPESERNEYVMPWRLTDTLRTKLEHICQRAGVEYLGYHSLRHYAGTQLYAATRDLATVAKHLGHSNINTSSIYAKWSDEYTKNLDF